MIKKKINQLTSADAVKQAIAECDKLGREKFLEKYGYKYARKYPLIFNGKEYDSKAIAGVAYGRQHGQALTPYDFSGGIRPVVPVLEKLGFEVRKRDAIDSKTRDYLADRLGETDSADSSARFFWVNVGLSYSEVVKNNFLWAPQFGEYPIDPENPNKGVKKRYFEYWTNVGDVRAGDIIFGNMDRRILFVAVATKDAVPSHRPTTKTFKQWNDLGFKVDIKLFELPAPLSVDGDIREAFDRRYNKLSKPKVFKSKGEVFQGYMAALPDAAGIEMLRLTGDVEADAVEASDNIRGPRQSRTRTRRKPTGGTTKQAVQDARIGQGYFRQELLKMWKVCPVTGVANPNLLLASHVKPWSKSNDDERLDPYNGFLFAPNIDRPFDKGLISFDDRGRIIISSLLSQEDRKALGIHSAISIKLHPDHIKYLKAHRKLFDL